MPQPVPTRSSRGGLLAGIWGYFSVQPGGPVLLRQFVSDQLAGGQPVGGLRATAAGMARSCNGTNSSDNFANASSSSTGFSVASAPFGVMVAFLADSVATGRGLLSIGNSNTDASSMLEITIGRTSGNLDFKAPDGTWTTIATGLVASTMYTVAVVWDGTNWLGYFNGVLGATYAAANTAANRTTLCLGRSATGAFSGAILWAAAWKRSLGAAEVYEMHARPFTPFVSIPNTYHAILPPVAQTGWPTGGQGYPKGS